MIELNELISRSIEMKLNFNTIYFLINGDYPGDGAVKTLQFYFNEGSISQHNFIRLIKMMPNSLA